jgi:nucleoside-diphosphate-sugar epimerase
MGLEIAPPIPKKSLSSLMPIFITGSTGFIGKRLVQYLISRGESLHLLARDPARAKELEHPSVKIFKGDITDRASMEVAMQGCDRVIHLASFVDLWSKDPGLPFQLNVAGTDNVLRAALKSGVKRVVCMSTAGTIGPSAGAPMDEDSIRTVPFFAEYESSKFMGEERALRYSDSGIEVVIVNPTRVFGPGELTKNNGWVKLMHMYLYKGRTVIPGKGDRTGNYVYVDDVVKGTVLALEKGRNGERYILGGDNVTLNEFFEIVKTESGKKAGIWHIPLFVIFGVARFQDWKARWFKRPPLLTMGYARRYLADWSNSVEKARKELGYEPLTLREGIRQTLDWFVKVHGPFSKK